MTLAFALVLAGCGGGGQQQEQGGNGGGGGGGETGGGGAASGEIAIEGSSTVLPISQAAAEGFQGENPDARVTVGGSGTGDGFEAFCGGTTQISDASRPIESDEIQACEEAGIEFVELPVALDGISVVVNPENDYATDLTLEELSTMWSPDSEGSITQWDQVRSGFPAEPFTLYGPGTESGTFDFFTEVVNGEEGASRADYNASEDDNVILEGVAGDPSALGYFGYAYFQSAQDAVRAVAIDGGEGPVEPTPETIADGSYPLSRPLFIYVSTQALDENPAVAQFVENYLANLDQYVEQGGYIALPSETSQLVQQRYESRTTGSLYNGEGDLQSGSTLQEALQSGGGSTGGGSTMMSEETT
ncbi:PstS family phosphate ABC transporter substrate-binding protein [Rubrobacter marinus]|uniref:PstS family phosphate ABC transporter substrate-binding protein n=1 Tax=Rubrobacter marinus TaxID=2653852 RepID=UPI0014072481|nr:PstS family phosphate ABC transporter substrate-binding protein [Rubrobacter marinus]